MIHERSRTGLVGFDVRWLPPSVAPYVRVLVAENAIELEVDGWVGTVRLLNGDTLRISSKFGETDFMRILMRANGISDYADDEADYRYSTSTSPIRYVIRGFLSSLRTVHASGLAFEWKRVPVVSEYRPDTFNAPLSAIRALLGHKHPFVGMNHLRSKTTAEHRVLGLAAWAVLGDELVLTLANTDRDLLSSWRRRFASVATALADIEHVQGGLRSNRYAGSRGYYVPALQRALIILGIAGLSGVGDTDITADAFLTNSDILFEKYVRQVLSESFNSKGLIFEKARPGGKFLFDNNTISLEPDLLASRGAQIVGIGDVKHKKPGPSDFHQLITYARQWGLQTCFILEATEASDAPVQTARTWGDGVSVIIVPLPMKDLDALEERLERLDRAVPLK